MSRLRTLLLIGALLGLGVALAVWAAFEARSQRFETEAVLRAEAAALARSLGPALAAASSATRELDEVLAWKLLDNARLLSRLDAAGLLREDELEGLLEANGLDLVLVLDRTGSVLRWAGTVPEPGLVEERVRAVAAGAAEEVVLGQAFGGGSGRIAAAATRPGGGAVLVRTDAATAYAFGQRLGVANLLDSIVGSGDVLYLVFEERPGDLEVRASWDGGDPPDPGAETGSIREVRGRPTFEVRVDVTAPAGLYGSLRVGLDAAPLLRASTSAYRRTALIGIVLAAFGLAGIAFTVVSRMRALERAEGERRLSRLEEARSRSERLAAAGSLAAGVAHEIRNPLNAIALAAQRIERRHAEEDDSRLFAGRIRSEVRRLEEILNGFLDFARPSTGPREPVDLLGLAREVVRVLEVEATARDVELRVASGAGTVRAVVDGEAIRRAIMNLVRNAVEASGRQGKVELRVESGGGRARIHVIDTGRGVDPDLGERAFDPFVTTRAEGTGLGLPLVRRIAEEHGGRVSLTTRPEGGAEAVLELRSSEVSR